MRKFFWLAVLGIFLSANATAENQNRTGVDLPRFENSIKGLNGNELYQLSPGELEQRIKDFKNLGVGWIRFDFEWNLIQPETATKYDWSAYDRVVSAVSAAGIRILGMVAYTPAWANGHMGSKYYPPMDVQAFANFAERLVQRYGVDKVQAWEIWNEPNLGQFWQPAADPDEYFKLLQATSIAIKKKAPSAYIVSGGLAQPNASKKDWDAREYLTKLYALGLAKHIDAVGNHPYTTPHLPSSLQGRNWQKMTFGVFSMLNIMSKYGDGKKPIWVTEFGAPTNGVSDYGVTVDEKTQARMIEDVYALAKRDKSVGPVFWYNYADFCPYDPRKSSECFYGLVRHDKSRKPGYSAYQAAQ